MSGGEPSSIKRWSPGAAVSPHSYAKQRSRGAHPRGPVPFSMPQNILQGVVALYRALYRKWRPRKFADVVGQEAIVTALQNQIAAGRIGHAYLFTGTRGTGKTTCAKIFAKAVNCLDTTSRTPAVNVLSAKALMRAPFWMYRKLMPPPTTAWMTSVTCAMKPPICLPCASIRYISSTRCTCCLPRRSMPC